MDHQRTIEDALRRAHAQLFNHLPPPALQPDDLAVNELRALVRAPHVREALERGPDTLCAFSLRAMHLVLCDQFFDAHETLARLRPILDDAALNAALGIAPHVQILPPGRPGRPSKRGPQIHRR